MPAYATQPALWWDRPPKTVVKTGAYTLTGDDDTVLGDVSGGAFTLTLPPSSAMPHKRFLVKKPDTSANHLSIATAGSDETFKHDPIVNGDTTLKVKRYGSGWWISAAEEGDGWIVLEAIGRVDESFYVCNSNLAAGRTSLLGRLTAYQWCYDGGGASLTPREDAHLIGFSGDLSHGHSSDPGDWTWTLSARLEDRTQIWTETLDYTLDNINISGHNIARKTLTTPQALTKDTHVIDGTWTGPSTDGVIIGVLNCILLDP